MRAIFSGFAAFHHPGISYFGPFIMEIDMSGFSKSLFALALAATPVLASAEAPACTSGQLAYVSGEINNNAIVFNGPLPQTLGIAHLRVSSKHRNQRGKRNRARLTCALHGVPNTDQAHDFDHRIVCDDDVQSELSFNTHFTGEEPLKPRLESRLCQGQVLSYFQEYSVPDTTDPAKGLFQGVYEGELTISGCVNAGDDSAPDIQINMVVDGYLCLEN